MKIIYFLFIGNVCCFIKRIEFENMFEIIVENCMELVYELFIIVIGIIGFGEVLEFV